MMNQTKFLEKVPVGYREFGEKVDITDPCYDKDVWCRMNGVEICPGEYECVAWFDDDDRVKCCGIYLNGVVPKASDFEVIGTIGVDAGLAGFFDDKPDYSDEQWNEFCESIREGNAWIKDEGFLTSSGWGDGEYPVFAHKSKVVDKIDALEIWF